MARILEYVVFLTKTIFSLPSLQPGVLVYIEFSNSFLFGQKHTVQ